MEAKLLSICSPTNIAQLRCHQASRPAPATRRLEPVQREVRRLQRNKEMETAMQGLRMPLQLVVLPGFMATLAHGAPNCGAQR